MTQYIAIAFPEHEIDRERLRALARAQGKPSQLPARSPGAVVRPCVSCGMALSVGPRLASTGLPVHCPSCGMVEGADAPIAHLGGNEEWEP